MWILNMYVIYSKLDWKIEYITIDVSLVFPWILSWPSRIQNLHYFFFFIEKLKYIYFPCYNYKRKTKFCDLGHSNTLFWKIIENYKSIQSKHKRKNKQNVWTNTNLLEVWCIRAFFLINWIQFRKMIKTNLWKLNKVFVFDSSIKKKSKILKKNKLIELNREYKFRKV